MLLASSFNMCGQTNDSLATQEKVYKLKKLDTEPDYPGGIQKFNMLVVKNFRTPDIDKDIDVTVVVGFVVEKDGSVSNFKIVKDPGHDLGKIAIENIERLKPKLIPGTINAKPVRSYKELPIKIKIESPKTKQ